VTRGGSGLTLPGGSDKMKMKEGMDTMRGNDQATVLDCRCLLRYINRFSGL
jgi:hypothetical protein